MYRLYLYLLGFRRYDVILCDNYDMAFVYETLLRWLTSYTSGCHKKPKNTLVISTIRN